MKIKRIVVHCTESTFGDANLIRKWHTSNGWRDIGYHIVILNGNRNSREFNPRDDGLIEPGRSLNLDSFISASERGAHAYGFNGSSIGICLVGHHEFTEKQMETLFHTLKFWKKIAPEAEIVGHYELNPRKTCPNLDMDLVRAVLGSSYLPKPKL